MIFTLYQKFLSPALHALLLPLTGSPHACRFTPTCSQYSRQAVHRYGIMRGSWLSLKRLLRCHPFTVGGHDPVPNHNYA